MSNIDRVPDYPPARDYTEILYGCNFCGHIVQGSSHAFQEHMLNAHGEYVCTMDLGCYALNAPDPPEEIVREFARGFWEHFPFPISNPVQADNELGENTNESEKDVKQDDANNSNSTEAGHEDAKKQKENNQQLSNKTKD